MKQLEQLHNPQDITEFLTKIVADAYTQREKQITPDIMRQIERWVSLQVIDNLWMDHLDAIDDLREGIGLRGYGQRDPLVEYKNEAFNMFERLVEGTDSDIAHRIFKVQVQLPPGAAAQVTATSSSTPTAPVIPQETAISKAAKQMRTNAEASSPQPKIATRKLGRNDPCWCGSGKKWKKCHYPSLS